MTVRKRLLYLISLFFVGCLTTMANSGRTFQEIKASDGLADNSAQTIKCTRTGRIVVTTLGNINFYDGVQFSHISTRREKIFPLPNYQGHYHLYFDKMHHLWLKSSSGVSCVNMTLEQYITDVDSVFKAMGMKEQVTDMFVDSEGTVWMMGANVIYNSKSPTKFTVLGDANLQDLEVVDGKELLLFYSNGEVMGFDVNTERILFRNKAYGAEEASDYDRSCVMVRYKDCFFQIRNGHKKSILLRFDIKSRQWTVVTRKDYHMNNIALHNDMLYIPTEYGYFTYDIATGSMEHEEELTLVDGRKLLTDINVIEFDLQGGLWAGTENRGLLYSRQISTPFKKIPWSDPEAMKYKNLIDAVETNKLIREFNGKKSNCMYMDSRNWTWVGGTTGLYLYKNPKAEPIRISRNNGLLNNVVHSIVEDNSHHIWVSTSSGISCVFINADTIRLVTSYNAVDNVPEETFRNGRVRKLDDGSIVMQTLDYIVKFDPEDFRMLHGQQTINLKPKLIRILVNGADVEPNEPIEGHVILKKAVARTDTIFLSYDLNNITMIFSGLNYVRPLQTYFRVRVLGRSDKWEVYSYYRSSELVDKSGRLHLPILGLEPKTYTVEVQSSMFPDKWETEPYRWVIVVSEPWWRASGMFILLGVVLLSLLVVNFFIYNRNTRLRIERKNSEGDIIRRVRSFLERTREMESTQLSPLNADIIGSEDQKSRLSDKFVDVMQKIIPYVSELRSRNDITMKNLSNVSGVSVMELYDTLSADLYKSPRQLVMASRLNDAAEMLRKGGKTVEEVADECGFSTPNFFIATFYHQYKMPPRDYAAATSE